MVRSLDTWAVFTILAGGAASVGVQSYYLYVIRCRESAATLSQRAAEADLRGEDATTVWLRAREAEPRSAFVGVNTGLVLERAGRAAEAERVLLDTERVNHLWLPRWTLASFYLRAGRREEAARWGHLAMERSYVEVRPALFGLLEEAEVPAREWLSWCGQSRVSLANALDFLGRAGKGDDLAHAVKIMATLGPGDAPALWQQSMRRACSNLTAAGKGQAAIEAWNALIHWRTLPYGLVSDRNLIGNPEFAEPIDGEAFNWRFRASAGISRNFDSRTGSARLRFDGSQPERTELLATTVWLKAGVHHRLIWEYEAEVTGNGPIWEIAGARAIPMGAGSGSSSVDIPATREGRLVPLVFTLNRQPGFTRAVGEVDLRRIRLEVVRR